MHPTAIARTKPSAPMAEILDKFNLSDRRVLHFGRGKAILDTLSLSAHGSTVAEYDPYVEGIDTCPGGYFDYAIGIYVFNVLTPTVRQIEFDFFRSIADNLIWTVRCDPIKGEPYLDGVITKRGTFQKQYTKEAALDEWPNATILACHPRRYITLFQRGMRSTQGL